MDSMAFRPGRLTRLLAVLALSVGSMAAVPATAAAADNQAPVVTAPDGPIHISEAAPPDTVLTLATFTDDSAGPWTIEVWGWAASGSSGLLKFTMTTPGPIQVAWPPDLGYTNYQVTVRDGELYGQALGTVIMDNVAPELTLTLGIYNASGKAETHTDLWAIGAVADPGLAWFSHEKMTCTVDFGAGQGPKPAFWDGKWCSEVHVYEVPGTYTITMVVTDAWGASDTESTTVTVIANALTVTPDPIPTIDEGDAVTPAATFSGGLPWATYSCTIDYGDGTVAAGTVEGDRCTGPAHRGSWGRSGDYPVWFTVTDDMGETGINVTGFSYVNAAPTITSVSPLEATAGVPTQMTVTFDDPGLGSTPPETYYCEIDFGDWSPGSYGTAVGNTCTSSEHTYAYVGLYTLTVEIFDGADLTVQQFQVAVTGPAPHIDRVNAPDTVAEGTVVSPSADFTSSGFDETCLVQYGDGTHPPNGWYFEGTISGGTCTAPGHVYAVGTYSMYFQIRAADGTSDWASKTITVVNQVPVVSPPTLTGSAAVGSHFAASATFLDPGSASETYTCRVDYGDGTGFVAGVVTGSTCQGPDHVYTAPAIVTVTVAVDDGRGDPPGTSSTPVEVSDVWPTITSASVPTLALTGTPIAVSATFDAPGLHLTPPWAFTCYVNFGDAAPVSGTVSGNTCQGPAHTYTAAGNYTVNIYVTDPYGANGHSSSTIVVTAPTPVMGQINAPASVAEGTAVQATADFTSSGLSETCSIDFGDGTVAAGTISGGSCAAPSHVYAPGTYAITFTIAAANGTSASGSRTITVADLAPAITPANVLVQEGSAGLIQIGTWTDFGTGTWTVRVVPSVGQVQEVLATQPGPITIPYATSAGPVSYDIFVIDPYGQTSHATASASFVNVPPTIVGHSVSGTPAVGGHVAVGVTFSDPGFGTETYTCTVDYGDGSGPQAGTISGAVCTGPLHTYVSEGTYTAVTAVTDSNGGVGTLSLPLTVNNLVPQVGPVSAPATTTVGTAVTASATYVPTGLDPTDTCTVDYGDGSGALAGVADGATCTGPAHAYAALGTFQISVTVTAVTGSSAGSSASIVVANPVIPVGPVSVTGSAVEGASVTASATFTGVGSQTYTCKVDYGDGAGALPGTVTGTTCKGPGHKLGRGGSLTVTVVVTGSAGSTGQSSKVVSVTNVGPAFTKITIPTTISLGSTLTASVTFSDPGTTETYQVRWIWGDGTTTTAQVSGTVRTFSATHRYAAANVYAVNISLTDGVLDDAGTVFYNPTVAMYDPARTVSGSGTFASPAGSCTLSPKCAVASTATFSLSGSYARGATKPTGKFTFSAAGISFTATSYDWLVAANGSAGMTGAGTVNGVSGYRYYVTVWDTNPDWIEVYILDGHGNVVYLNNGTSKLRTGSITVK